MERLFVQVDFKKDHSSETAAHRGDAAAGADRVVGSRPVMKVRILSPLQVVLVSSVVGFLVDHEAATPNLNGAAAAQLAQQIRTVAGALKVFPREVLVFIEDDLNVN